jgi:glutathione S-transferase
MTIKLYTWPMSSGVRIHWALEELGLPFERVVLDRAKNEHRDAAYLAIHPGGKVPAIVDGDDKVFESPAILVYLGEKYGVEKRLWPKSGPERADALSWTVWAISDLQTYLMQYAYHGLDSPVSYKVADRSKAAADFNHGQLMRMLDALESRLATRDYVLGASFTLADLAIASVLGFGKMFGVDFGARPKLVAWLERCGSRPAMKKAQ